MAKKITKKPLTMKELELRIVTLESIVSALNHKIDEIREEIYNKKMCINVIVPEKKSIWGIGEKDRYVLMWCRCFV